MGNTSVQSMTTSTRFAQIVVGVVGISYSLAGIALIFFPFWFFLYIGNFAPFNRHYEGDAGAFILAIGIGLLLAVPRPKKYSGLIFVAALASMFHAANHIYDAILYPSVNAWLQTLALLIVGVVLLAISVKDAPFARDAL
jgi:hypothetical protein